MVGRTVFAGPGLQRDSFWRYDETPLSPQRWGGDDEEVAARHSLHVHLSGASPPLATSAYPRGRAAVMPSLFFALTTTSGLIADRLLAMTFGMPFFLICLPTPHPAPQLASCASPSPHGPPPPTAATP